MKRFLSVVGQVFDSRRLRETAHDLAALAALSLFMMAVWVLASAYGQVALLEAAQ